jgi:hypothetical protein
MSTQLSRVPAGIANGSMEQDQPISLTAARVKGFGCRPVVTYPAVLKAGVQGEGFRMPAGRDLSSRTEGRRPKAPQEGTRGEPVCGLPSMGI